ncbi:N-acetylglucosamine-1-phosphodiester alpha-N-acetylglucosaminidase-like, partial [Stegodyphus dumicola]|uniref:N-acetylglucosamine-1-phosphodiester alpha-N-acetylglucosaminidase-like n=1 Tax=Stegodyphus dumicola TaxID=202533 RepID=UPI0015AD905A
MIPLLLFALLPHINLIEGNSEVFDGKYSFTESLTPYIRRHGSRLSHRSIRECHQEMYGSPPHELFEAHQSNNSLPLIIHKRFVKAIPSPPFSPRTARGHYIVVPDPLRTLSVLEPDQPGGCKLKIRQSVAETSAKHNCVVSLNAGYFNTKDGSCLGNVISDSRRAQDSNGIQNVHFGLTEDGHIFVGYLSKEQFLSENFKQLVGGVVWILRNGSDFVNDSKKMECEDTEETGPMERFVNILSARSVIGHDKDGNIILLQVDGKSEVDGINLYEMQSLLKEFGFVNAVNLDGGGSSTLVMHGVTANYPYDEWYVEIWMLIFIFIDIT